MNKKQIKQEFDELNKGIPPVFSDRKEKNQQIINDNYVYSENKKTFTFTKKKIYALCSSVACIIICLIIGLNFLPTNNKLYFNINNVKTSLSVEELNQNNDLIEFKNTINDYQLKSSSLFYESKTNKTLIITTNYYKKDNKIEINYLCNISLQKNINNYVMYKCLENKQELKNDIVAEYSVDKEIIYMKITNKSKIAMIFFENETLDNAFKILDELLK